MVNDYKKAYTEVLEILSYFPNDEYSKIPQEKIEFFQRNKDNDYVFKINPNIDLSEQNISREANTILVALFRDYFATDNQKVTLNNLLKQNQQIAEKEKAEKYNPNDIFKKKETILNEKIEIDTTGDLEKKETRNNRIQRKFFHSICKFYKKNIKNIIIKCLNFNLGIFLYFVKFCKC